MKTWKIVGITGLLLAGLLFSGTAQARRFDNHSYNRYHNQKRYSNQGYHHQPRWAAARERSNFRQARPNRWERGRHRGWDRGNHYGWGQRQHRMAAYNSHRW